MAMVPKMDQIPNIPKTGNGKLMMIFKKSTLFPPKKLALLSKKMTTLYVLIEKQQKYFCNSFFYLEYNDHIFVWLAIIVFRQRSRFISMIYHHLTSSKLYQLNQ